MSLKDRENSPILRKARTKTKSKKATICKCLCSMVCCAYVISLMPNVFNLWINVSPSIPYGIYKKVTKYPQREDYILFCLENEIAKMTVDRHYITRGNCAFQSAPIGKKVVATQGDLVKISDNGIEVNGRLLTDSKPSKYDNLKRKMPVFWMDRYLDNGEFIVASTKENSYDSRYFGIVRRDQIKGVIETIIPS